MINKFSKFYFILLPLLCMSNISYAEIYKWIDESGKVHFSDKPSRDHTSEAIEVRINSYESVSYDSSSFDVGKKVVMYSASWCGYCTKARNHFKDEGIRFTEYDIEKTAKGKSDYKRLNAKGVPVILVGNKRMNGFSVSGFDKLYE